MTSPGLKALLLDLDDTLIDNSMDTFIPAYFRALEAFVSGVVDPERFIKQLLIATRTMDGNDGSGPTNEEVFAAAFYPALGVPREEMEPLLARFYSEAFPQLEPLTRPRRAGPKVVEWSKAAGLQVVIATNPLFPRTAIEQRMAWGEVGVDRFDYDLVTCYENSRATKSSPAYFQGVVEFLGRDPKECLMVGDNWGWDVVCAGQAGVPAYWIASDGEQRPEPGFPVVGRGDLDAFLAAARDGSLEVSWSGHTKQRLRA
jgi:FMN phosphatase YigB (HAD superfamily)